jgi:chemotaxis protein histidine kinase CheA
MAKQLPIEIFMPPNILKAKVGSIAGGIDLAALKRAEAAMDTLKTEFNEWLTDDISRLALARDGLANSPSDAMRRDLFRAAHDLKGQAETYGYPLIARMAASLSKLVDETNKKPAIPIPLIDAHVVAIRIAFRDKISMTNDTVAVTLAKELEARVGEELAS